MQPSGDGVRQLTGARHSPTGRERELGLLRDHLDAVFSGEGRFVLVGGEAGIGKTAIAERLAADAATRGALLTTGQCLDLTTSPPYGPWLDVLRTIDHVIAPGTPFSASEHLQHPESQAELFAQVWEFLAAAAASQPLVVILEDLHWADVASLDLLRFISRRAGSQRILLLATYRVDDLTRRRPLFQMLPAFVREGRAERIDVRPLDAGMLREIVRGRYALDADSEARLVDYLMRQSEGNPFYFNELLRSLEESNVLYSAARGWVLGELSGLALPPLLVQVIEGRLARLPERARQLLTIAAVIGTEIPLDLWQAVSGAGEEELADVVEQAREAAILAESRGGVGLRFAHALMRETLYEVCVLPRRRVLHRAIGEYLLSQPRPDADAVAHHLHQAGDDRAASWLIRAGENASALHAPDAAVDYCSRALALSVTLDSVEHRRSLRLRGLAFDTIGDFEAAEADLLEALRLACDASDSPAEWQVLLDLGMLWAARDYARTAEYYQRALVVARQRDDPAMLARSLNRLGNWLANIDRPAEARAHHLEALASVRALDDLPGTADTLDFLGMTTTMTGDLRTSAAYYDEAIALFWRGDDRKGIVTALATMSEGAATLRFGVIVPVISLAKGESLAREAIDIARSIGWRSGEIYALCQFASCLWAHGSYDDALEAMLDAERIAEDIEHHQWRAGLAQGRGELYAHLLAVQPARAYCEQAVALCEQVGAIFQERVARSTLARVCLMEQRYDEAERLIAFDGVDEILTTTIQYSRLLAWHTRAELMLLQGDAAGCLRLTDRLLACTPPPSDDQRPLWTAILRGEALASLQRWDEAEAVLRASIRDAQHYEAVLFEARARFSLAALYALQGRRAHCERERSEAATLVERLARSISDVLLRETFVGQAERLSPLHPAAAAPSRRPFGLSNREIDVLQLVAEGLTDAEVAERLYISRRTVTSHLTSIYNKLGVATRTAAARLAAEHALL